MPDIFGRTLDWAGSFEPEGTTVEFAGVAGLGAVVRSVKVDYQQSISRIWDLGTGNVFFVAGHTQGSWGIGTIAGVSGASAAYGTICDPGTMEFSGGTGVCGPAAEGGGGGSFTLHSTILSQIGVSVVSDDMIINQAMSGTFLYLEELS